MEIGVLTRCFRRLHSVQEVKVRVLLLLLELEPDAEPLARDDIVLVGKSSEVLFYPVLS